MERITIALRGIVPLPHTVLGFDVSRFESVSGIETADMKKEDIFLATQVDAEEYGFKEENIRPFGTLAQILQIMRLPNGGLRVTVRCTQRALFQHFVSTDNMIVSKIEEYPAQPREELDSFLEETMVKLLQEALAEYGKINQHFQVEDLPELRSIENLEALIYKATNLPYWRYSVRYEILAAYLLQEKHNLLYQEIRRESDIFVLKSDIQAKLRDRLEENQKEFVLREQLKIIKHELGEEGEEQKEEYLQKIGAIKISEKDKNKLRKDVQRLESTNANSPDFFILKNYLDSVLELPFDHYTMDNQDLKNAMKILNEDHYGLEKIKERIVEYLAVRILNPDGNSPILCLVGPPGTGKTSIAKSVARALGRKYVRLSLGGVKDEAEIRGHRKTYVGAMPGRIIESLRTAKSANPLMLLDEIDKTSGNYKGDLSSALLEVLDAEQNSRFVDHYIEIGVDLSKVLFLATANSVEDIPAPLLDRMEVIEVNSYTENEKYHIAKKYLVNKQAKANGITPGEIEFTESALRKLIHNYTREAGVRKLERTIGEVCRKCAIHILENKEKEVQNKKVIKIKETSLEKYLGKAKYNFEEVGTEDEIGMVTGLAWTRVGGDTLSIEVNLLPGKSQISLTGRMGDVMKESARIGFSYVRSVAKHYGISSEDLDNHEIHLHIPEGAVPKDGPSAGITMATAMLSAFLKRKVRADVAMTGEITLRGKVLPVGGLKEKLLAAKIAGVKTVIVPYKNKVDIAELSDEIIGNMEIVYAKEMDTVVETAFVDPLDETKNESTKQEMAG